MATPLNNGGGGAFAKSVSRWEELKNTVSIIVDIASVMDKDGLDVYFLNRATSQLLPRTREYELNDLSSVICQLLISPLFPFLYSDGCD